LAWLVQCVHGVLSRCGLRYAAQMRQVDRDLKKSQREIEREIRKLQMEEKKTVAEIKKLANQGQKVRQQARVPRSAGSSHPPHRL
jgi:cell division protein FtsB